MILFFDTETTGFIAKGKPDNHPDQPHLVQLAAILTDDSGRICRALVSVIACKEPIAQGAADAHGITNQYSLDNGSALQDVAIEFSNLASRASVVVAHNVSFDKVVINAALSRCSLPVISPDRLYCTMKESTDICKIPHTTRARNFGSPYKWPKLAEAYKIICGKELVGAHDALNDVRATMELYFACQVLRRLRQQWCSSEESARAVLPPSQSSLFGVKPNDHGVNIAVPITP